MKLRQRAFFTVRASAALPSTGLLHLRRIRCIQGKCEQRTTLEVPWHGDWSQRNMSGLQAAREPSHRRPLVVAARLMPLASTGVSGVG